MFDPIHLESFLAVAQTRNFTEAARRLGLQQSTVSQHIRKLEQSAERRLFVRDTHHVTLTPDGEAITRAGQAAVVPMGPPMVLTGMGTQMRRSVVLVLHDTRAPWMTITTDWKPAKACVP